MIGLADFDDFDLGELDTDEDSDLFDSITEGSNSDSNESDFEQFSDNQSQTVDNNEHNSRKDILKQAGIIIIIGVVLIILAFAVVKWLGTPRNNTTDVSSSTYVNENVQNKNNNTQNDWIEISKDTDISFNENYINSVFTITSIDNVVKVIDGEKNIMIKSVLTGTLDGIRGTYELDVPYYKGVKLSVGMSFNVRVQIGEYKGKSVIGEIDY